MLHAAHHRLETIPTSLSSGYSKECGYRDSNVAAGQHQGPDWRIPASANDIARGSSSSLSGARTDWMSCQSGVYQLTKHHRDIQRSIHIFEFCEDSSVVRNFSRTFFGEELGRSWFAGNHESRSCSCSSATQENNDGSMPLSR